MKNTSIWSEYLKNDDIKSLDKDMEFDIVIIGGGITGLSVAYSFLQDKKRVCLLEKNFVGSGVTSKTTAKITYLQEGLYEKISKIRDKKTSKLYYESQKIAIDTLIKIIKDNKIACDLTKTDSYLFTLNKNVNKLKSVKKLLESFNEQIEEIDSLPDGLKVKYGIKGKNTYTFHPIKYLNGLKDIIKNRIPIYEDTCVNKITRNKECFLIKANNYHIKCKYVILCTHYPYFLFPYLMPLKCSLEKSYIGVFEDNSNINFQGITNANPTLSIRYIKEKNKKYKLLLTNSTNLSYSQNDLENFMPLIANKPKYVWSNIDIITKDYLPYIGLIDENFYIATGFNTWGMTNGTLSGMIIHDLINNNNNKYAGFLSPKRSNNLNTSIKYPLYMINNIYSFANSKIIKNKCWYSNKVKFKTIDGVSVGIYRDELNHEYIVKNKCPHLGCSLIFNEVERTWDCPCHGSRFDIFGKVIEGPSNYDIIYHKKS